MNDQEFAQRATAIRGKLYKTAMGYLGSQSMAMDVLDETIYKGLCSYRQLRKPEAFDSWLTRILIRECYNELRRNRRFTPMETLPETASEDYDRLPLKEAVGRLPTVLRDVVILRYLSGYTLAETAELLRIPQGTVVTRQRRALQLLRLELDEEVER